MHHSEENKKTGWVKLYRSLKNHWIWKDAEKLKWWIDLQLTVNHSDQKVLIGETLIECKRGQTVKSLKNLSHEWGVSRDKVRSFLIILEKDNMITRENLAKTTRITICNYESYQDEPNAIQTQPKRNPNATQTHFDTNKNDNNIKNEEELYSERTEFDFSSSSDDPNKINTNWVEGEFKEEATTEAWQEWIDYKIEKYGSFNRIEQRHSVLELKERATVNGEMIEQNCRTLISTAIRKGWKDFYLTDEMKEKKRKAEMQ